MLAAPLEQLHLRDGSEKVRRGRPEKAAAPLEQLCTSAGASGASPSVTKVCATPALPARPHLGLGLAVGGRVMGVCLRASRATRVRATRRLSRPRRLRSVPRDMGVSL